MEEQEEGRGQIIWACTDSQGRYRGVVVRTDDRHAVLELRELQTRRVIKSREVGLMFGAIFGPDMADVSYWQGLLTVWSNEEDVLRELREKEGLSETSQFKCLRCGKQATANSLSPRHLKRLCNECFRLEV